MTASIKSVINSASESKEISYDDTVTQLGANNLQDALIKVVERLNSLETELNGQTTRLAGINTTLGNKIG